ncbi:hypothetical protein BACPLE_01956 [Phocaeicola plebeius DSM 17135]|uniref:Uncharacterized protein n=1 Tax=Phocaeicola plebeius (strain DSM 17135 / JCM 12973 / CCUG 54634 / M2) TaxID=484018 RepID=B5CYZ9_PHOPM|nr:hypothetical protein BACPLE_01956 [Phocaeicola plebeius DSM 17135]
MFYFVFVLWLFSDESRGTVFLCLRILLYLCSRFSNQGNGTSL